MLRVGDQVKFLNESGGGIITRIEGKKKLFIEIEKGLEIPVNIDNVVKVQELEDLASSSDNYSKPIDNIKVSKPHQKKIIREVDLHIENLSDNPGLLNNSQKLKTQLDHFQSQLEKGILENCPRMVFIHGIGSGVLRSEIRRILKGYENVIYQDGSYKNYGIGATEVIINFK